MIVRVNQSQKDAWEDAARRNGMTLAAYIRRAVDLATGSEVVAPIVRPREVEPPAVSSQRAAETASRLIRSPEDVPAAIERLEQTSERTFKPDFKAPATKKGRK